MTVPICDTTCGAPPPPSPPPPPECPTQGAKISIPDSPQVIDPSFTGEEILFVIDNFEYLPTDADAANNRIIIGADGLYLISATITYGANGATQSVTTCIFVNGAAIPLDPQGCMMTTSDGTNNMTQNFSTLVPLDAGDIVTLNGQTVGEGGMPVLSAALSVMRQSCDQGIPLAPGG